MQLKELYGIADGLAPFALSREYCQKFGHHDNSGILVDCGEELTGVLFSLDLSASAVEAAKKNGANCIFTHHPAIFYPIPALTEEVGAQVLACAKAGISVISAHLNLDSAAGGIDESLMQGLGGQEPIAVMDALTGGAYGRVYEVEKASLPEFIGRAKKTFRTERVVSYGNSPVWRVASFCGAGFGDSSLRFALANGADTIVSSDAQHHLIAGAIEKGLNVVLLTHYATENYGFHRFYLKCKELVKISCDFFTDERLI